jgi:hypothetical protein
MPLALHGRRWHRPAPNPPSPTCILSLALHGHSTGTDPHPAASLLPQSSPLRVPISVSHRLHVFLSRGFHFSTTGEMGAARRASSPNPVATTGLQSSAASARLDALSSYRSHAEPDGVGGPRPGLADGRRG